MRRLVIAWLAVTALGFAIAGSCAIEHRSGAFECVKTADCTPPRVCSDGLCVQPSPTDAPMADARPDTPPPIDAPLCPSQCTSCNPDKMECTIDCGAGANCVSQVVCPKNWSCTINCSTLGSCRNGVTCEAGDACNVTCSGRGSCRDVVCGPGACNVSCTGSNSCDNVQCGQSCACDVACTSAASCVGVSCGLPLCHFGSGCSSLPPGCNTCP